jgi:predicted nucleic acid-binding protein
MRNNAYHIVHYPFSATDKLLFDANIWLDIYGPQGNPTFWRTQIYSKALVEALKAKSVLYIDVLILSEFINRYARLEFGFLQNHAPGDFKTFRNTPAFIPIAQSITNSLRRILRHCTRTESGFSTCDIETLLTEYQQGGVDFNDQILTALCKTQGFAFVTHDADFKDQGLTILSANKRLLKS